MGPAGFIFVVAVGLTASKIEGATCPQGGHCLYAFGNGDDCDGKTYSDKSCGIWFPYTLCSIFRSSSYCEQFRPKEVCCILHPTCAAKDGFCAVECLYGVIGETRGCGEDRKCCKPATCSDLGGTCGESCQYGVMLTSHGCAPEQKCCSQPTCPDKGGVCSTTCPHGTIAGTTGCDLGQSCCDVATCPDKGGFCSKTCSYRVLAGTTGCDVGQSCCQDSVTNLPTTGRTNGGVAASEREARAVSKLAKKFSPIFEKVAKETGISKYILLGIASRETNIGRSLDANGEGDEGRAYGIMQIDKRHNTQERGEGPSSYTNVKQGADILKRFINRAKKKFPSWEPEWQLRAGIAMYNLGPDNVRTKENLDVGSKGDDYSSDVIARAQFYKRQGI